MSDSESSEEIQIQVEQKLEAKLRDLLERAKLITPFYDDDILLNIYKECFSTDQVFLNKLEIIAKNHKEAEESADSEWIHEKKHNKQRVGRTYNVEDRATRKKYNFLQDKLLIQRAKKFDPQRQREEQYRHQEYKESHNKGNIQYKKKYQQKEQKPESSPQPQHDKKMKYKEKLQPSKTEVHQQKPSNIHDAGKYVPKRTQKKEKFVEKKVEKVQEVKGQNTSGHIQPKKQQQKISHPQIISKASQQQKKQGKIQYKAKEEPKSSKVETSSQPLPVKTQDKTETKPSSKIIQTQKVESPKKLGRSQKDLDEKVKKQFEASCKQNTFILKFIPPTDRLQKVSYIREPNGNYIDVKTREVLPRS